MGSGQKPGGSGGRKRRRSTRSVTISDVAALAEVSTATVSRALAAPDTVSAAARARVLSAVEETGYTPNRAARSLRVRRTMTVLVVVPWQITPFFSDLLLYLDRALAARGYSMLIGDLNDRAEQEPRIVNLVAAGQVDGMILLNGDILSDGSRRVDEMGIPIVGLCVPIEGNIPAVLVADRDGGAAVAEHFLALGHRRFGYVSGPDGNFNETERFGGYVDRLAAAGIPPAAVARYPGTFHVSSGAAAGERFLAEGRERPTAVFCASDMMAIGFMLKLQSHGVRVPADVSVVGFDGIELGAHWAPPLVTVEQPSEAMARAAAEAAVALLGKGGGTPEPGADTARLDPLPVRLRPGGSTAAPPRER